MIDAARKNAVSARDGLREPNMEKNEILQ